MTLRYWHNVRFNYWYDRWCFFKRDIISFLPFNCAIMGTLNYVLHFDLPLSITFGLSCGRWFFQIKSICRGVSSATVWFFGKSLLEQSRNDPINILCMQSKKLHVMLVRDNILANSLYQFILVNHIRDVARHCHN